MWHSSSTIISNLFGPVLIAFIISSSRRDSILIMTKNWVILLFSCSIRSFTVATTVFPVFVILCPIITASKSLCFAISFAQFAFRAFMPQTTKQCLRFSRAFNSSARWITVAVFPRPGASFKINRGVFNPNSIACFWCSNASVLYFRSRNFFFDTGEGFKSFNSTSSSSVTLSKNFCNPTTGISQEVVFLSYTAPSICFTKLTIVGE